MSPNLTERFPNAKGYATRANAQRAVTKAALGQIPYFIAQREADERWLPIVIVNGYPINAVGLAERGMCITNA